MSAADSGGDVRGVWLSSADTDQWCHLGVFLPKRVFQLTGVSTKTGICRSVFFW